MSLGTEWVVEWVRTSAAVIAEHRVELITLDREIGDGDHGENMDRGFSAVLAETRRPARGCDPGRRAQARGDDADLHGRRGGRPAVRHRVPQGGGRRGRTRPTSTAARSSPLLRAAQGRDRAPRQGRDRRQDDGRRVDTCGRRRRRPPSGDGAPGAPPSSRPPRPPRSRARRRPSRSSRARGAPATWASVRSATATPAPSRPPCCSGPRPTSPRGVAAP